MIRLFLILLLLSCTDLLINTIEYHSIELKGNSWVQINQGTTFNKNNFTLQTWFSGSDSIVVNTQTIFSMVNSDGEILIGIFKDPVLRNQLNIWIDNQNIATVESLDSLNNIDLFNLLTIKSNATPSSEGTDSLMSIDIFINKNKLFSENTNLSLNKLNNIDFIVGGKVSTDPQSVYYEGQNRGSFWHGCIDEIRFWNVALSDSIINYHNDNPSKLSFQSDSLAYIEYLGHLDGLWRFYTNETAYFNIQNDACTTIERLYNDNPCSTDSEATIYTIGDHQIEFSEKHK